MPRRIQWARRRLNWLHIRQGCLIWGQPRAASRPSGRIQPISRRGRNTFQRNALASSLPSLPSMPSSRWERPWRELQQIRTRDVRSFAKRSPQCSMPPAKHSTFRTAATRRGLMVYRQSCPLRTSSSGPARKTQSSRLPNSSRSQTVSGVPSNASVRGRLIKSADAVLRESLAGFQAESLGPSDVLRRANFTRKSRWSGRKDSNLRPLEPHSSALPGCATPRLVPSLPAGPKDTTKPRLPAGLGLRMSLAWISKGWGQPVHCLDAGGSMCQFDRSCTPRRSEAGTHVPIPQSGSPD